MKKRVISLVLALALVLTLSATAIGGAVEALAAESGIVIKLHYNRPDGDYTDWTVWMWADGQGGEDIPFAEEDGDMVATYSVPAGTVKIGFIVRTPDWTKDVGEDQFIEIPEVVSGTVHVYVESGVKGYTRKDADDVVTGTRVNTVKYDPATGVVVTMTGEVEGNPEDAFVLKGPDGAVKVSEVKVTGYIYTLIPAEGLDLFKDYTINYGGMDYNVVMPNIYSTEDFESQYTYTGNDLGATWTKEKTTFRLWAPTAAKVCVNLYKSGTPATIDCIGTYDMKADVNGTWVYEAEGDLNGVYYTYSVTRNNETVEVVDPYARTTGVNGKRAMVIDLDSTDPEGWAEDKNPNAELGITDSIIYELHVRDLSLDDSSGITNKGKYLGLIETGTTNANGVSTGLDHLKDLGITHLHLLPVYDYGSVDESKLDVPQFNWGYDPMNYNVPEGSYSTDPFNGEVRVSEFKQMVKGLHDNGISVIMDVVYNHVYDAGSFSINQIVPGYFSRINTVGSYSNGSGCGNDTASERSMVKKYIVDSVKYWADEYHIDGFRFDLVGLIDTETINEIIEEVHKTHPDVIFYGEGWTMSTEVTKEGYFMTTQTNSSKVPSFAFFSDTIRDLLKGTVFDNNATGYVSGSAGLENNIEKSFMAMPGWTSNPTQIINYASCHDNMSLFDRLTQSTPNASVADRIRMNNLAAAIYMTSQGVPFMQAGEEMLRSKPLADGTFDHNSYSSPDSVNSLKWDNLNSEAYQSVYEYYKGLIAFRKAHSALRMTTNADVVANITPVDGLAANVVAFNIAGGANGEVSDGLFVIFNPNSTSTTVTLPEGNWNVYINGEKAGTEALSSHTGSVTVDAISAMVLVKEDTVVKEPIKLDKNVIGLVGGIAVAAAAAVSAAVIIAKDKKKQK